jgi:hypothetical protein
MNRPQGDGVFRAVTLDRDRLRRLLDKMDAISAEADGHGPHPRQTHRKHERRPHRVEGAVVTIDQARHKQTFVVPIRNVSKGGLAFLHRNMLHVGTPCTLQLACGEKDWITIEGEVAQCRHIEGMLHEIGVAFKSEIDLDRLAPPDPGLMNTALESQADRAAVPLTPAGEAPATAEPHAPAAQA